MKVALVGYGKMGKEIEAILKERGHKVTARITSQNRDEIKELHKNSEIAIEFSRPDVALENFKSLIEQGIPTVTGTTGWYEHFDSIDSLVKEKKASFFYATNFSVGVNLFFEINRKLAQMMKNYPSYKVSMEETHHTQKLDAPSGTAITIAEGIINEYESLDSWKLDSKNESELSIAAHRIEGVPGTHEIHYDSEIDSIDIKHTAHSRKGFALGAVLAAEFLFGKVGVYNMKDLLQ